MSQITKDTMILDVLDIAPGAVPLFQSIGMHCLGCALAKGETLDQACMAHGVDTDEFIKMLNDFIESAKK